MPDAVSYALAALLLGSAALGMYCYNRRASFGGEPCLFCGLLTVGSLILLLLWTAGFWG